MSLPSVIDRAIPGGWTQREVKVGDVRFRLTLPAAPDELLNQAAREPIGDEADPYWAELWPAAESLAEFVLRQSWVQDTPVLELGCGIGLVGLAALRAGLEVTFSDRQELAVATALENAARNGFLGAHGRVIDWRAPPRDSDFPLILAADVLYNTALHQPLLSTLEALLAPKGIGYIADPGRSSAEPFVAAAFGRGFNIERDSLTPVTGSPRVQPVLYRLQRCDKQPCERFIGVY